MTDWDGDRRPGRDATERPGATRPRTVAIGFAILTLLASVAPIPDVPLGAGAGAGPGAGGGALPVDVGLTAPFHFLGYAVLAALVARVTGRRPTGLALAALVATAFGFGIELVQAPIPWRSFAWSDAAVNAAGAVVGAGAIAARDAFRRPGSSGRRAR